MRPARAATLRGVAVPMPSAGEQQLESRWRSGQRRNGDRLRWMAYGPCLFSWLMLLDPLCAVCSLRLVERITAHAHWCREAPAQA